MEFTFAEINNAITNTENIYSRLLARQQYLQQQNLTAHDEELASLTTHISRTEELLCLLYPEFYALAETELIGVETLLTPITAPSTDGLQ